MLCAEPTEVPPNFKIFIVVSNKNAFPCSEEGVLLVFSIVYTIQSSSSGYLPGGCGGCSYGAVNGHFCNACKVSRYFLNMQGVSLFSNILFLTLPV
jgi:hypothetical protein